MNIAIGSDHAGFDLKERIKVKLFEAGILVVDKGTFNSESVDYPDFAVPVCQDVLKNKADFGILICGTGNGMAITANKLKGIRAGLAWTSEIAVLSRSHNNANVLVLPARFIDWDEAMNCVNKFLQTKFEGGRHQNRIDKIDLV